MSTFQTPERPVRKPRSTGLELVRIVDVGLPREAK